MWPLSGFMNPYVGCCMGASHADKTANFRGFTDQSLSGGVENRSHLCLLQILTETNLISASGNF